MRNKRGIVVLVDPHCIPVIYLPAHYGLDQLE